MAIEQTLLTHLVVEQPVPKSKAPNYQRKPQEMLLNKMHQLMRQSTGADLDTEETTVLERAVHIAQLDAKAQKKSATPQSIISMERLNDLRYINKFLEAVNANLPTGGYLVGSFEPSLQRKQEIMGKFPGWTGKTWYTADFLVNRVWPKLPRLRHLYFCMTKGRNRVLSEMEVYGRLFSCGFCIENTLEDNGNIYFIAKKVDLPDYNLDPTYGPLIRLNRVGKNGKMIKVYKFRTMSPYSEYLQEYIYQQCGLQEGGKLKDDPRVNTVGKFMRKYWLDEFPMLINLVKGDMKLFGVRPISKHYLSLYPKDFQEFRKRFKPGLLPPFYADLPKTLDEIVESEKRYLEAYQKSPWLTDLRYLVKVGYNILVKMARSH